MSSVFGMLAQRHRLEPVGAAAAGGVWLLDAGWPDLVVAGLAGALLLRSSLHVIRGALAGLDPRQTASGASMARPVRACGGPHAAASVSAACTAGLKPS